MFQRKWLRKFTSFLLSLLFWTLIVSPVMAQQPQVATEYSTGDAVPGDFDNQVQIMKRIYLCVQIYRQRHEGHYPIISNEINSMIVDMTKNLSAYGFNDFAAYKKALDNPDNKYADDLYVRQDPGRFGMSSLPSTRKDGSGIDTPRPKGTRDILSITDIYYHKNSTSPGSVRKNANPVGFYAVLWDDGTIEKIAYDQIFYIPTTTSYGLSVSVVFPTEAGLPWNCLTYGEYMKYIFFAHHPTETPLIGYPLLPGQVEPKPDNGGIESLVMLTRLFDHQYDREQIWDSLGHQVKNFTLQEVMDGAAKIDFPLQKKTIALDELQKLHTPTMLYLSDAGRIVTMSTIDDNHAIIYDRGMTLIVDRAELAKRYSGEALIAASVNTPSALEAEQPIRTLNFSSKDAEVVQNVKITNHGAKPVSLLIERPLCGITDAKLSQDTLAPGESTNLELHFKWRTVLPGDHQSTFVTLKTDDPVQPRLQLGFDLKLAGGA